MRKIEKLMVRAIVTGSNWASGNTSVSMNTFGEDTFPSVFLHGNHIATVIHDRCIVNLDTLRRWPTAITKSRLRALGADLVTKNGQIFLNGVAI